MDQQQVIDDLLDLIAAEDVEIRRESMGGTGGGLCHLKKKAIFYVDTEASVEETLQLCGEAVKRLVDTEIIYLRPQVRQVLEQDGAF